MFGNFNVAGLFTFEHIRAGKLIDLWEQKNLIVDVGLNAILDYAVGLTSNAGKAWYVGLLAAGSPGAAWTVANLAAGNEFTTYTVAGNAANRADWTKNGAAAAKAISNSNAKATYLVTGLGNGVSDQVTGAFMIDYQTKGNSANGTLLAAAAFSAARTVVDGDTLLVTYSVTASG